MNCLPRTAPSALALRAAWAVAAAGLVAGVVAAPGGIPWWAVLAVGLAPDVPLLAGFAPGLAKGQLAPRAVPFYNALHRVGGPVVLGAAALAGGGAVRGLLAAALAWGAHIAWDRALGYGLRTKDGFQRG